MPKLACFGHWTPGAIASLVARCRGCILFTDIIHALAVIGANSTIVFTNRVKIAVIIVGLLIFMTAGILYIEFIITAISS